MKAHDQCAFFVLDQIEKYNKFYNGHVLAINITEGKLTGQLFTLESGKKDNTGPQNLTSVYMDTGFEGEIKENWPSEDYSDFVFLNSDSPAKDPKSMETGTLIGMKRRFEEKLHSDAERIGKIFEEIGIDFIDDLNEEVFAVFPSDHSCQCKVSFADLKTAYDRCLRDNAETFLEECLKMMRDHEIDRHDKEKFRLLLSEDAENFYLLRKQILDTFCIGPHDRRIWHDKSGTAQIKGRHIIETGAVSRHIIAPESTGMTLLLENGEDGSLQAFRKGERLIPDEVYMLTESGSQPDNGDPEAGSTFSDRRVGEAIPVYFERSGNYDRLVIQYGENERSIAAEMESFLPSGKEQGIFLVGFSIDEENDIYLHLWAYDLIEQKASDTERKYGLIPGVEYG